MKKRLFSTFTALLMVCSLVMYLPQMSIWVSAASNAEIRSRMISILYNNSGGYVSCDFDGYTTTAGRHEGIDCCIGSGSAVYSLIDGEVIRVNNSSSLSTLAIYDSVNDKTVIYLHSNIQVSDGAKVSRGQFVAYEDSRGASAAHTHVEVRDGYQQYAAKSVNDYMLENSDPYPYWGNVLFGGNRIDTPVDNGYVVPCERTASQKYDVYDVYGNAEYNSNGVRRYIDLNDSCTIHEVYSSGYVKVTYPVGNSTHTAYAKNDGWNLEKKETALTAGEIQNLGDTFTAQIWNVNSGKNLTNVSNNVVMYDDKPDNTAERRWTFTRNSNGSYTIANNINTNDVIDVADFEDKDGTNIGIVGNWDCSAQHFFIYKRSDGKYYFKPECSQTRVLDVSDNSGENGANVQLYTYNGTDAQLFYMDIQQCPVVNLGDDFSALILNSDVNSKPWKPILQDDNYNVVLGTEKKENFDSTLWHFTRHSEDNTYTITSYKNGRVLDLNNFKDEDGSNISCVTANGSTAQRWYILRRKDGTYKIRAKCAYKVMDIAGGLTDDGTNVHLWTSHDGVAQCFAIYQLDKERDKLNYSISADKTTVNPNESICVTVGGDINYVYNYKFHVLAPDGKESVTDNKCNRMYSFKNTVQGTYTIWAEIVNPLYTEKGSETSKSVTINVKCAHNYTVSTTGPTCTEEGSAKYTCTICGDTYTEPISATGHKWNAATYTWSADNKTCTVKRVCANDSTHVETETVSTTYSVSNQPTNTNKGTGTYTATFKNTAFAKQTKNVDIPPLLVVTSEVSGRQFRLKWTTVPGAEKYGIALYQAGKWRVKAQFAKNVTTFTSPKMKTGSYRMVVCAKVNGEWDTSSLSKRAFTVKIV